MSQRAQIPTILARTSQPGIEVSLLLALATLDEEPHTSPSAVSPFPRFFARLNAGGTVVPTDMVHPLTAFVAGLGGWRTQTVFYCPVAMASDAPRTLQTRCFRRAPSLPYFPCSPSVTRFGAYPAPCGTARLCFGLAALRVTAFRKSLCKEQKRKKIFRTFRKSAAWHLGAGHLASLRAGVSRGQSGQIQTGEMTWHSTKTTSS